MKKRLSTILFACPFICLPFIVLSQRASDVLENGIRISSGKKFFLRMEDQSIKYDIQKSMSNNNMISDFITLKDSSIFLVEKSSLNTYLCPMNPLLFEYETTVEIKTDPINDQIVQLINTWESQINSLPKGIIDKDAGTTTIREDLLSIKDMLKNDSVSKIIEAFNYLKDINFIHKDPTIEKLGLAWVKISKIKNYYLEIESSINKLKIRIENEINPELDNTTFLLNFAYTQLTNEFAQVLAELKKKYSALEHAYTLVNSVKEKALNDRDGVSWCIRLSEIGIQENKIAHYSFSVKSVNYSISDKGIISKTDGIKIANKNIRFRKHQSFVPEVSVGGLYTFIDYNTYGIITDANGNQVVSSTGKSEVKNLKLSTTINYTLWLPHSSLHPFYQLGLAINSDIPTIVTGVGIRSNLDGLRRFTFSVGLASTWVKDLDQLKLGDKVDGPADLEKDLKYQFVWPPRPYIGFFRNF